nr:TNF receptor-associated factor homolog 1b-like isoform X2 [Quercus suber]
MANLFFDIPDDISRSTSDAPTMHYTVKIKSFSLLAKNSMEKYDTGEFESGGYKWKLVIYPNGNKDKNVTEYISLYLAIEAADLRPPGWEVHAIFRFFLHDQIRDNYLTIEDTKKKERRFRGIKLEWGYDKVIPLKTFKDASNGYLVDDTCVFGAEVFVSKQRSMDKGEGLELIKESITNKYQWTVYGYSKLTLEYYDSNSFNVGNYKWKICLRPNGEGIGMGSYNSLYLALVNKSSLSPGMKIFAEFTMRILNLTNVDKSLSAKRTRSWWKQWSLYLQWLIQHPEFVVQNYQM